MGNMTTLPALAQVSASFMLSSSNHIGSFNGEPRLGFALSILLHLAELQYANVLTYKIATSEEPFELHKIQY
jgi:hypothetical protein